MSDFRLKKLPPLSLYIHIPWCLQKCPYCDFNSYKIDQKLPEKEYLQAMRMDIENMSPASQNREIETIFIGGGTPSLFSAETFSELLAHIKNFFNLSPDIEITLEANPCTFKEEKFCAYRDIGINRLSIGIQSFSQKHLEQIGRVHNSEQAHKAIEIAKKFFDNFNLDLMYGLPFQTLEELKNDIETALLYAPKHISYYQLTMEPDTPFGDNPPSLPEDEACWEMQKLIESYTEKNGFEHYEVSAYAKKNHRAKHNLNYWLFGDYLGIGAGAHSKISFPNKIIRQARISDPKNYIKKSGNGGKTFEGRVLEKDDLIFEFMLNALRLTKGFSLDLFEERTGLALNEMEEKLSNAIKKELIFQEGKIIKPTGLGKSFLSDLQEMFL